MILALAILSLAAAHKAVETTERDYWHGQHATIKVSPCHRVTRRRATCVSQAWTPGDYTRTLQQVTLEHGGYLRVHELAEVQTITLDEAGKP